MRPSDGTVALRQPIAEDLGRKSDRPKPAPAERDVGGDAKEELGCLVRSDAEVHAMNRSREHGQAQDEPGRTRRGFDEPVVPRRTRPANDAEGHRARQGPQYERNEECEAKAQD